MTVLTHSLDHLDPTCDRKTSPCGLTRGEIDDRGDEVEGPPYNRFGMVDCPVCRNEMGLDPLRELQLGVTQ